MNKSASDEERVFMFLKTLEQYHVLCELLPISAHWLMPPELVNEHEYLAAVTRAMFLRKYFSTGDTVAVHLVMNSLGRLTNRPETKISIEACKARPESCHVFG